MPTRPGAVLRQLSVPPKATERPFMPLQSLLGQWQNCLGCSLEKLLLEEYCIAKGQFSTECCIVEG